MKQIGLEIGELEISRLPNILPVGRMFYLYLSPRG